MLDYNEAIGEGLRALCSPVSNILGMNFCYVKKYKDNKQLVLMSDTSFIKDLFELSADLTHSIPGKLLNIPSDEFKYILWASGSSFKNIRPINHYTDLLFRHGYRIGISITRSSKDSEEVWAFIPSEYVEDFDLFCMKNSWVFTRFINYFNNKAAEFMKIDTSKLNLLNYKTHLECVQQRQKLIDEEQSRIKNFIDKIGIVIKTKAGQVVSLSRQEIKFLSLLSEGNSLKQIARILDISPKTSENHMYNIKAKTGYSVKYDLIKLYLDQSK